MSAGDLRPGWIGQSGRLPHRAGDLHGPASGVIVLPRILSLPGMRECDVSDAKARRALYAMLLTHGSRYDIARLVNAAVLRQDWPLIRNSLNHKLIRRCERRFDLRGPRSNLPERAVP